MIKRTVDLLMAIFLISLIAPLAFAIALMIRIFDGSPILFAQERVGREGNLFRIYKFRSMRFARGPQITAGSDPRITRIGGFLRASKLDEIPQLWNVFMGDMSFVGPRPEVPKFVALYSPAQLRVLNFKPGITDPASLVMFNQESQLVDSANPEIDYVKRIMPLKIEINLAYADRAGFLSDMFVIALTGLRVFGVRVDVLKVLGIESRVKSSIA